MSRGMWFCTWQRLVLEILRSPARMEPAATLLLTLQIQRGSIIVSEEQAIPGSEEMDILVRLDTGGAALAGIDYNALTDDITSELEKLAKSTGSKDPSLSKEAAPAGAMGDFSVVEWLLHVASQPAMAKVYAQTLVYAINAVLTSRKGNSGSSESSSSDTSAAPETKSKQPPSTGHMVTIEVLGKEFLLPTATAVIQAVFDSLKDS